MQGVPLLPPDFFEKVVAPELVLKWTHVFVKFMETFMIYGVIGFLFIYILQNLLIRCAWIWMLYSFLQTGTYDVMDIKGRCILVSRETKRIFELDIDLLNRIPKEDIVEALRTRDNLCKRIEDEHERLTNETLRDIKELARKIEERIKQNEKNNKKK